MAAARPAGWEAEYATRLVTWMRAEAEEAGAEGAVFGLSGGVDSAVVGGLCVRAFPRSSLGLILPCGSDPRDVEDAHEVARTFGLEVKVVALDEAYRVLLGATGEREAGQGEGGEGSGGSAARAADPRRRLALANLKVRLRAVTLYFYANLLNRLVIGTGNRAEIAVGYFTKYGDSAVDILPLANLVKGEVRALARHLGVPERVIAKPPTAGLWPGQTDEGEMGLTYEDLDRYLLGGEVPEPVEALVREMHRRSEHKRRPPRTPDF